MTSHERTTDRVTIATFSTENHNSRFIVGCLFTIKNVYQGLLIATQYPEWARNHDGLTGQQRMALDEEIRKRADLRISTSKGEGFKVFSVSVPGENDPRLYAPIAQLFDAYR